MCMCMCVCVFVLLYKDNKKMLCRRALILTFMKAKRTAGFFFCVHLDSGCVCVSVLSVWVCVRVLCFCCVLHGI